MGLRIKIKNFLFNMSKKRLVILITLIVTIALIIGGFSFAYAYFTMNGTKDNLIKAGCLKVDLAEVNNINLTNSIPITDIKGLSLTPYTYTLTNTCTTDAYYEANLAVLNITNNDNIAKVKVALAGDSYLSPTIVSALSTTTLNEPDSSVSSSYLLDTGYLAQGESKSFDLRLWINYGVTTITDSLNAKVIINAVSEEGPSFSSKTAGYSVYKNSDKAVETNNNPNYGYISPLSGDNAQTSGLFKLDGNSVPNYYFRGNVDNNYVSFANKTWRIVRINEDGSLKLILDDNSESQAVSSNIATSLNTWYTANLSVYTDYLLASDYCSDNSSSTNNGSTYYGAYTRNVTSHSPSIICGSTATSLNIGLLTADEVSFAGGLYNTNNNAYYLYKNYAWWTTSPSYTDTNSYNFSVDANGAIESSIVSSSLSLRPVITLSSDAILSGTGLSTNKYEVIGKYSTDAGTYSDTTAPTFKFVRSDINGKIVVSATDGAGGMGVGGYYISSTNITPTITTIGWINQTVESYTTSNVYANGTYYVWVKDIVGNISAPISITINVKPNSPEMTSNMVPIYYDEADSVWKKADSSNVSTKYQWYDYSNKKWANVATLYESGFEDYGSHDTSIRVIDGTNSTAGLTFDGTDDLVVVDNGFGVKLPATYSVTFKTSSFSTNQIIFGDVDNSILLGINVNGYFAVAMNGSNTRATYSATGLSTNTFYNITMVVRSISDMDFYIDGVKQTTMATTNYFAWQGPSSYIGGRNYTGINAYPLNGTIKNIMMWDDQLTAAEALSVGTANNYKSVPKDNLKTYFDFTKPITRSNLLEAKPGTTIPMSLINSMWVWIPRYKYQIQTTTTSAAGNEAAFNITWETNTNSTGNCNISSLSTGCTYTHPAFTFGDQELKGFWIAKFETGVENYIECSRTSNTTNCNNYTLYPIIKPNTVTWKYSSVGNFFWATRGMELSGNIYGFSQTSSETLTSLVTTTKTGSIANDSNDFDVHMLKNSEWGAVAYLSHSNYGTCTNGVCEEIYMNNSYSSASPYLKYTGVSAGVSASSTTSVKGTYTYDGRLTSTAEFAEDRTLGYKASTTGNIYGAYDMNGGTCEYVMGNYSTTTSINTTTAYFTNYATVLSKYYNKYTKTSAAQCASGAPGECLGHALYETTGWYSDSASWLSSSNSWFYRGNASQTTSSYTGIFSYWYGGPDYATDGGTRAAITK